MWPPSFKVKIDYLDRGKLSLRVDSFVGWANCPALFNLRAGCVTLWPKIRGTALPIEYENKMREGQN